MSIDTDQRPPVAIGHVRFSATDVPAAMAWLHQVGLRRIFNNAEFAVMELRGGTHLVIHRAASAPAPGTTAPFDLMVDDIDAAHHDYAAKGFNPSAIRRGHIHDSFEVVGPDGYRFEINSSHAGNRAV